MLDATCCIMYFIISCYVISVSRLKQINKMVSFASSFKQDCIRFRNKAGLCPWNTDDITEVDLFAAWENKLHL